MHRLILGSIVGGIAITAGIWIWSIKKTGINTHISQNKYSLEDVKSLKKGIRVLFIGNSFTNSNGMPDMIRRLAEAAGEGLPLLAVQETPGGFSLQRHFESGNMIRLLEEARWDYVVVQEQSQRPSFPRDQRTREIYPYLWLIDEKIRAANSRTILFMTWGIQEWGPDKYTG